MILTISITVAEASQYVSAGEMTSGTSWKIWESDQTGVLLIVSTTMDITTLPTVDGLHIRNRYTIEELLEVFRLVWTS
jgi:hypothetical protein